MDGLSVAITGVSGFLGQRVLLRLAAEPRIGRIVGLDVREPPRRAAHLTFHRVDIAGSELKSALEGVDVVLHLASVVDPVGDEGLMARVNVEGTRRVLDAAGAVGVRKVVRVSSAAAYGAWAANPIPLTEDAPLRPNPGFAPAVQAAEAERLLREWHDDHPDTVITTLRAAPVLGAGAEHLWARLLTRPARLRVREEPPPVQVVHVDDVAAALVLAVGTDLPGAHNVAADGWLSAEEADALRPRPTLPAIPAALLRRGLGRMSRSGIGDIPPGVVPYLVHPWVLANDRLRAAGWVPEHTNEETILETVDARPTREVPVGLLAAAVGGAIALGLATGLAWRVSARRRGVRRSRRPTRA